MNYAPIALFVYNRPEHTRQTVVALKKNFFAAQSDLIVFSDAAKSDVQADGVSQVRQYIQQIDGFKSVTIVERKVNFGLAQSIIVGVTTIVNEHGRIIVLEDDLITSPHFLEYMNAALDTYQTEEKVMHVSGYMFPLVNNDRLPSTFFYRATTCWGWGTWKSAWDCFNPNSMDLLKNIYSLKLENEFDIHGTMNFTSMLRAQSTGQIDSWAIRWYATVFLKGGLCLHPSVSLVNNVGHDGSGMHCASNLAFAVDVVKVKPIMIDKSREINESIVGLEEIKDFNLSLQPPFYLRILPGLLRRFKKLWVYKMRIINEQ